MELGDRRRRVQSAVSEQRKSRSGDLSLRALKDFCKLWTSLSLGSWGCLRSPNSQASCFGRAGLKFGCVSRFLVPLHSTKARNLLLRQWENRVAIIRVLLSPVDSREPVGTWRQTRAESERLKGWQAGVEVGWECQHLAQLPCARIIKRILFWEGLDFKLKKKKKRSRVASLRENRLRLWKGLRWGTREGFQGTTIAFRNKQGYTSKWPVGGV